MIVNGGKPLLDVLGGVVPSRRPIWFMRQAGRYLPEYRQVREKAGSFLNLCYNPELAAEVTLQPLRRYDLDAAILFADILVVPHAMGLEVRFEENEGPLLEQVSDLHGVERLKPVRDSAQVKSIADTIGLVKGSLRTGQALIGFCGGPWTVASYIVEGGTSDRRRAKVAAIERLPWFVALIERLVAESISYLGAQIEAGAEVIQLFDSWAGELSGETAELFVVEPLRQIVQKLRDRYPDLPVIVFGRGFGVRQPRLADATGAAGIGLETELAMEWAEAHVPKRTALQGNLDPVALRAGSEHIRRETRAVLKAVPMERHVFNLGHGIQPGTNPDALQFVIGEVRSWDESRGRD